MIQYELLVHLGSEALPSERKTIVIVDEVVGSATNHKQGLIDDVSGSALSDCHLKPFPVRFEVLQLLLH